MSAWPTELRLDHAKADSHRRIRSRRALRACRRNICGWNCPAPRCRAIPRSQKQIVGGKREVKIAALEPVGNYAVRILFDDGHDTGLYSWDYLHELGREHDRKWAAYLAALKVKRLER